MKEQIYLNDLGVVNYGAQGKEGVLSQILSPTPPTFPKLTVDGESYSVALSGEIDQLDRVDQLLEMACQEISQTVEAMKRKFSSKRIGVILGITNNGPQKSIRSLSVYLEQKSFPAGYQLREQEPYSASDFIKNYFELQSLSYTVCTACTSSSGALVEARKMLRLGLCDAVVAGGVDTISESVLKGFISLESVDQHHTNPFSRNRVGINLGEGAALFVLSKEDEGEGIVLSSAGESLDAKHPTAPDPEGGGAIRAMRESLQNLSNPRIDYVNLHGTGTRLNDSMESIAMNEAFKALEKMPLCSGTKPMVGHTLGASGAMELGFCWLLLSSLNREKRLPIHFFDQEREEDLPSLNFVRTGEEAEELERCMSNSYAFGGCNISLIIERTTTRKSL